MPRPAALPQARPTPAASPSAGFASWPRAWLPAPRAGSAHGTAGRSARELLARRPAIHRRSGRAARPWPGCRQAGPASARARSCIRKTLFGVGLLSELRARLHKRFDGPLELVAGVGGRDLSSDSRFALRHDRVREADHVDPFFEHGGGHPAGEGGVADHYRHDRMLPWEDLEFLLCHAPPEEGRVIGQPLPKTFGATQN